MGPVNNKFKTIIKIKPCKHVTPILIAAEIYDKVDFNKYKNMNVIKAIKLILSEFENEEKDKVN